MMEERKEVESLLQNEDEESVVALRLREVHRRLRRQTIQIRILLAIVFGLLGALGFMAFPRRPVEFQVFSPANNIIKYDTKVFYDNIYQVSPYQGEPDDEKDAMWDLLYRDTENTFIPASEVQSLPNRTMAVPGTGGGGIISLEVFHQLHCLNSLRKSMYPDRFPFYSVFFPNGTRNAEMTKHQDHCIDRLRQGAMCRSEVGYTYWKWSKTHQRWWINMESTHSCRNFDAIRDWAVERNLPRLDLSQRSHLTAQTT